MIGLVGETSLVGKYIQFDKSFRWRYSINGADILSDVQRLRTNTMVVTAGCSNAHAYSALNFREELDFYKKIVGAISLLECPHFIFASTSHVYGDNPTGSKVSENMIPNPVTEYGRYKLQIEEELALLTNRLGVRLTCLRIFSIFESGMKEHFLAGRIEGEIAKCNPIDIHCSDDVRDFSTSRFIGEVISRLAKKVDLEHYPLPTALNVGTGNGCSIREKVQEIYPSYTKFNFIPGHSRLPSLVANNQLLCEVLG